MVAKLTASGRDGATFVRTDVGDREQIEAMAASTLEAFGQIDILVNNAGWTHNGVFLYSRSRNGKARSPSTCGARSTASRRWRRR